jgi:gliding motility-associated-like protein
MKNFFLPIIIFLLLTTSVFATHNRAGEITYEQISLYFYKATITTYTVTSSPADRPELELFWGDGTSSILPRASFQDNHGGPGSDIRKNIYIGFHTYPGPSVYKMFFEDPNRNGGVINIPNSILVPFYVESQLIISAFLGFNNSPVLLQAPIDNGVIGQVFIHNPNAFDPDGDSLSYELIFCKASGGISIPGYTYPNASNFFFLDPVTGDLIWDSPTGCGEYNVAFLIKEWRNGVLIGFVERDMQITILCNNPTNNVPPNIASIADLCVTAGDLINFTVTATDPNTTNLVTLTGTGAPYSFTNFPAQFTQPTTGIGNVSQDFIWQTDCENVRKASYQFVFKAEDNEPTIPNFVKLVDLETVRITVVAPAPTNPTATPVGNSINLTWDQSICVQATGYSIYRRSGFYGYVHGPCETGVPSYTGYVKIKKLTGLNNTTFQDDNNGAGLAPGTDYCYMIVADFADGAESFASVEVCAILKKDLPVITNVSVTSTNTNTGSTYVAWSKPTDLDLAQFPAPHEYRILRSPGINTNNFTTVGTTFDLNDTTFNDSGLNTVANAYTYKIQLYATVGGALQNVGPSLPASSIYLTISPTDEQLILSWSLNVPWQNNYFAVYRYNGITFDSIGFSNTTTFNDTLLNNGQEYCYYIKSSGNYSGPGYVDPIINLSQQVCATPYDNVPPCALATDTSAFDCITRKITLTWNIPDVDCADDVDHYNIYYSSTENGTYSLLATVTNGNINEYEYTNDVSIAGCYYVTAVDTNGNEGQKGTTVCVDNCPYYELTNIFTPDGNGFNDLFVPYPYRYIQSIDLKIFNRWGLQVFTTTDPAINWNGKTDNTGEDLPYGNYFYICKVNEIYLSGIKSRELKGYLQLLRTSDSINK